jgi:hypothetical protein
MVGLNSVISSLMQPKASSKPGEMQKKEDLTKK